MNIPASHPGFRHYLPLILPALLHGLGAIGLLVIGYWLAGKAESLVGKVLGRSPHLDPMLRGFFGSIAKYSILTITVLTVLSQFGVQTTSLVAVIGAASLAIGLALQGTLSNLAAGVMLLIFRPFRLGHHIQVGANDGVVRNLTLFWTEVVSDANLQIIIPNNAVWGQALRNFSVYTQPAAMTAIRIPAGEITDLGAARQKVRAVVDSIAEVAKTPAPAVMYSRSPTDNSLQFLVKFTAATGDADVAAGEVIQAVQAALQSRAEAQRQAAPQEAAQAAR